MLSRAKAWITFLLSATFSQAAMASDLEKAPPNFFYEGKPAVFADFSDVDLRLTFDAENQKALGLAVIEFQVGESGMPIFDLIPAIKAVRLDGEAVELSKVYTVTDPQRQSTVRILGVETTPGTTHTLEINYDLTDEVTFSKGTVATGFFVSDLDDRQFWEQYAPTNLEYDQFKQTLHVDVLGTDQAHEIFSNGDLQQTSNNSWIIEYPEYYTTSSAYFHLVAKGRFKVARSTFNGLGGEIPLTVYSGSQSNVTKGMDQLKRYMAELEGSYGAFAHKSFTAYITDSGGGMEYCGATVTSLWALGHETTHSWFARGVMPSSGNSGWIDEAIASWRDDGYPRGTSPVRTPRVLAGFSPYKRFTTMDAYSYGADLISDFDGLVAKINPKGMKDVLRNFFSKHQRQTITVPMFQSHMEEALGRPLQAFFDKFIYGKSAGRTLPPGPPGWDVNWNRHPRPYTKEEMKRLR